MLLNAREKELMLIFFKNFADLNEILVFKSRFIEIITFYWHGHGHKYKDKLFI